MDDAKQDPTPEQEYEPPTAQDVETQDAPSVSAAGSTKTIGAG